jgi:hypothetical protein
MDTGSVDANVDIFPRAAGLHADTGVGQMRRFAFSVVPFSNVVLLLVDMAGQSSVVRMGSVEGNVDIFP